MRRVPRVLLLSAVLLLPTLLGAQVPVEPARLYLSPDHLQTELQLDGLPSGAPLRLFIAEPAAGSESGAGSCADWCTVTPEVLPDGAGTVSVRATPPSGLADGEYHAMLTAVRPAETHGNGDAAEASASPGDGKAGPAAALRLPLHFRIGEVYSDVTLENVSVERSTTEVRILLHFRQLGNAAYRGNLQLSVTGPGNSVVYDSQQYLDVYGKETLVVPLPASRVRAGTYRVNMRVNSDREDLGVYAIPVMPKKFSVDISMS